MAARAQARAAKLPRAADITDMAMSFTGDADRAEVIRLSRKAVAQAEQLAHLLGRLAALVDSPAPAGEGHAQE